MRMYEKIDLLIRDKGLTQTGLESMAGLPENRISKWKGGQGEPTARQAMRIAQLLGVEIDWLIDDDRDGPPIHHTTDDDRAILDLFRALNLSRHEALRRLACDRRSP